MKNWLLDSNLNQIMIDLPPGSGVLDQEAGWIDGVPGHGRQVELGIVDRVQHATDLEASLKQKFGDNVKFDPKYATKSTGQIDFSSPIGRNQLLCRTAGRRQEKEIDERGHRDR